MKISKRCNFHEKQVIPGVTFSETNAVTPAMPFNPLVVWLKAYGGLKVLRIYDRHHYFTLCWERTLANMGNLNLSYTLSVVFLTKRVVRQQFIVLETGNSLQQSCESRVGYCEQGSWRVGNWVWVKICNNSDLISCRHTCSCGSSWNGEGSKGMLWCFEFVLLNLLEIQQYCKQTWILC